MPNYSAIVTEQVILGVFYGFKWENVSLRTAKRGRLFAARVGKGHLQWSLIWSGPIYCMTPALNVGRALRPQEGAYVLNL